MIRAHDHSEPSRGEVEMSFEDVRALVDDALMRCVDHPSVYDAFDYRTWESCRVQIFCHSAGTRLDWIFGGLEMGQLKELKGMFDAFAEVRTG